MALKSLLLRKRIDGKKAELEALRAKDQELVTREAELAKAIEELTEANTQEERDALESEIQSYDSDKAAHEEAKTALEREIEGLENDLAEEEAAQNTNPPAGAPAPEPEEHERKENRNMNTRDKIFGKMSLTERDALFARDDVKAWLGEVRSCIKEKRALTNIGVTIPTVMLGVLRQNIEEYSKLYKHVAVKPVAGEGRAIVMGAIPEAIWTDCCANLNELDLAFNDVEFGCWKVGGYYAVCNANLEDSDIDLTAEIMVALGQAIGRALDRAILYGPGTRMPLGIAARLAQTSQPADYPSTARTWVDLHTSNIKTIANTVTGSALFAQLLINMGAAKGKYSRGQLVHVMNETTYSFLMAQAVQVDSAGAIVSRVNGSMPVIGGIIEVLDLVPDYNIVSGYFDLYMLAERAGQKFASSEHVRFLQDQTVMKGTARYDGQPVIAEGFVINAINSQSAVTSQNFPVDEANSVEWISLPAAATVAAGAKIKLLAMTGPGSGAVTWASATEAKATVNTAGEVTGVSAGSSVISATCNGLTATCTVTVTSA